MKTERIIDAEFEELDEITLKIVPKKTKKNCFGFVYRTFIELLCLILFSLIVSRALGYLIYGI